jgi:hypothetical protein
VRASNPKDVRRVSQQFDGAECSQAVKLLDHSTRGDTSGLLRLGLCGDPRAYTGGEGWGADFFQRFVQHCLRERKLQLLAFQGSENSPAGASSRDRIQGRIFHQEATIPTLTSILTTELSFNFTEKQTEKQLDMVA